MGIGDFTPDDATAGAPSGGSSALDLYGLGVVGSGPIYVTEQQSAMGEHSGGGSTTYVDNPGNVDGNAFARQVAALSQTNPAAFQQWQQMLYAGDFYSGKPRLGVYGAADVKALQAALTAYQQVNAQANAAIGQGKAPASQPLAFQEWLNQRISQVKGTGGPGAGSTRAPLTISYTDPAELESAAQSAAQQALGRDLSQNEIHSFIGAFHSKEASAQRGAYNGDKSVTNPEVTGEATNFVTKGNQEEANDRHEATLLDSIGQLLGVL